MAVSCCPTCADHADDDDDYDDDDDDDEDQLVVLCELVRLLEIEDWKDGWMDGSAANEKFHYKLNLVLLREMKSVWHHLICVRVHY